MADDKKLLLMDDEAFDFKKILSQFIDYWPYYIISLILCLFIRYVFIIYSTPLYKVHSQVLVQDEENNNSSSSSLQSGVLNDFGGLFNIKNNAYNELAILQTPDLLEKVINENHLYITYFHKGKVRDVELYKESPFTAEFKSVSDTFPNMQLEASFPNHGNNNTYEIKSGDSILSGNFNQPLHFHSGDLTIKRSAYGFAFSKYIIRINAVQNTLASIRGSLNASLPDKDNSVINLDYITNIPLKGEDILNYLINAYLERNLNEKNRIADSTITFIDSRINLVFTDLGGIEKNIQHFKQSNNIADLEAQAEQLVSNTSDYYKQLNDAQVQLSVVKTMLAYVQNENNNYRPVPALTTLDPTFATLLEKYNGMMIERDRMLLTIKETNPLAKNLELQIANLRADLIKSLQSQAKNLVVAVNQFSANNNQLKNQVHNVPLQERQYIDLSRDRDVKQTLYLYLLQKKEETAITKASNISSASIIEKPQSEYAPFSPNKKLSLIVALVAGFALPTIIILLINVLNNRISSRDDITAETSCTILAEIGHSSSQNMLSMEDEGRSIIAEQFRIFRTNIDFTIARKQCPKILITSSISGEGKSFVAANIAQVYAYSGKKVLLIELDLRKPKLSSMLKMENIGGFSSYIVSGKDINEFIRPIPGNKNIFLLNSGPIPPNPAELILSPAVGEMFKKLESLFDVIIIDSPPIGVVIDAQILSQHSDVNLFVIRQGYSFKNSIDLINDIIINKKFNNLYLVLNDVTKGRSHRYGYGYGYSYGYGYGYGTQKPKSKTNFFKKFKS